MPLSNLEMYLILEHQIERLMKEYEDCINQMKKNNRDKDIQIMAKDIMQKMNQVLEFLDKERLERETYCELHKTMIQ